MTNGEAKFRSIEEIKIRFQWRFLIGLDCKFDRSKKSLRGVRNRKTFSARGANERITGARNCGGKEEEAWTNLRRMWELSASYASSHSNVDSVQCTYDVDLVPLRIDVTSYASSSRPINQRMCVKQLDTVTKSIRLWPILST